MNDRMQDLRDDLAYMREVVQSGDPAERGRGGAIIAGGGFLFAACSLLNGAASLNLLPWPPAAFALSWFVAMGLFGVFLFVMLSRAPSGRSQKSRVTGMAWAALGSVIFTSVLSCVAAQVATHDGAVWAVLPSVIFGVYGAGWTVSATLSGRGWEKLVGLGAFAAAVAIAFLSRSEWLFVAYAAGLVLLAGVPGLVMMREGAPPSASLPPAPGLERPVDGFDIDALDEVIHGRIRLGVMAFLASAETADFTALRQRLQATDGNLSIHLRKLEEAGYVRIDKSFVGRKPNTKVTLTGEGRAAFARYLDAIAALVNGTGG